MSGIGIISNPRSKKNKQNPEAMKRLGYILGNNGEAYETRSIDDIYKVAEAFKRNSVDILCINGGDGTNHVTLSVFIQVYKDTPLPKIAILRGGTMNTVAGDLKIKGESKDILINIIQKYYAKEFFRMTKRNLLEINEKHYGFIFGNGIVYNFLRMYYQNANPSPIIAAKTLGLSILKGFLSKHDPLFEKMVLEIDDGKGNIWKNKKYLTVVASTVDQIGLGFTPTLRSQEHPNMFHAIGIHGNPLEIAASLPRIWLNKGVAPSIREEKISDKIIIRSLKEPFGYTIDGDMHSPTKEIIIKTGPKLDFIIE